MSYRVNADHDKSESRDKTVSPAPRRERGYGRPSERIFRRSRAAQARRMAKDKADNKLIFLLLNVSVLGALILALLGVATQRQITGQEPSDIWLWLAAEPFLGISWGEIIGGGLFLIFAGWLFLILRNRPK